MHVYSDTYFPFSIAHCPFEELIEQIYDTLMETNIVNEKVVVGILWYYFGGGGGGNMYQQYTRKR